MLVIMKTKMVPRPHLLQEVLPMPRHTACRNHRRTPLPVPVCFLGCLSHETGSAWREGPD